MASRRPARPAKKKPTAKPSPEPETVDLKEGAEAEPPLPKNTLPFEIDPKKVEDSLKKFRDQLVQLTKKGRYTKVRFKF